MDLVSLKYWHWIVIGVVIGSLCGLSWSQAEPDLPQTGRLDDFKARVGQVGEAEATKGLPRFRNIRVLPGEIDPSNRQVFPVTFDRLGVNREGRAVYQPQVIYATTPFDGGATIQRYLENRKIPFDDRTQVGPGQTVAYGAAGGAVAIGLIWPTILRLLLGAGFARPEPRVRLPRSRSTAKRKTKRSWWPFGDRGVTVVRPATPDPTTRAATPITEADTAMLFQRGQKSTASDPTAAPFAGPASDEPKEYAGEWYPVARPHAEKHETPAKYEPAKHDPSAKPASANLKK